VIDHSGDPVELHDAHVQAYREYCRDWDAAHAENEAHNERKAIQGEGNGETPHHANGERLYTYNDVARAYGDGLIAADAAKSKAGVVTLDDFLAYMPMHQYLFVPTRELWPASSVDERIKPWPVGDNGKAIRPSKFLDRERPIEQMTWQPGEPQIIKGKVLHAAGWVDHPGTTVFNLYRAPLAISGDASKADPWLEHVRRIFPEDADHVVRWLAQRAQHPGVKINHALVLGGAQGIGKDTLLEPVKAAVGPWNWCEVTPTQVLGRFNGWTKGVVVRMNEARDLGEVDRFSLYDHCKVFTASPPDVLRVDEKHLREHYVVNVLGMIITTNRTDGLYLPADDRRHYVAWSNLTKDDFTTDYWTRLWRWYEDGGIGHVVSYLEELDLSNFNPKAPPPKTAAFWSLVAAGEAPESGELRDVIEGMDSPQAFTLNQLVTQARAMGLVDLADEFSDRKTRRMIGHMLDRVGYTPVRNDGAADGLFQVNNRRCSVYALRSLSVREQIRAARQATA
jgi:hypothetical protein